MKSRSVGIGMGLLLLIEIFLLLGCECGEDSLTCDCTQEQNPDQKEIIERLKIVNAPLQILDSTLVFSRYYNKKINWKEEIVEEKEDNSTIHLLQVKGLATSLKGDYNFLEVRILPDKAIITLSGNDGKWQREVKPGESWRPIFAKDILLIYIHKQVFPINEIDPWGQTKDNASLPGWFLPSPLIEPKPKEEMSWEKWWIEEPKEYCDFFTDSLYLTVKNQTLFVGGPPPFWGLDFNWATNSYSPLKEIELIHNFRFKREPKQVGVSNLEKVVIVVAKDLKATININERRISFDRGEIYTLDAPIWVQIRECFYRVQKITAFK